MKPLIIANWKMNPSTLDGAVSLARRIERGLANIKNAEVVIAPPFPFLTSVGRLLRRAQLGSQNVFSQSHGAYTGEVSAPMLRDLRVEYVLIGHSERRRILGESDEVINQKVRAVLNSRLTPVIAIGEELHESQAVVPKILHHELGRAIAGMSRRKLSRVVIAYEPVWAIGTGRADTPDNATRRAIYIRKFLTKFLGRGVADTIRILYGGSVNAKNAASFIARDIRGMEGLLVGGASLDAEEFVRIVRAVSGRRVSTSS